VIKSPLIAIPGGSDVLTYFPGKPTGFYSSGAGMNNTPEPAAWRNFIWLNHGSDRYGQLICLWEGGKSAVRTLNVGVWDSEWSVALSDADIVDVLGNSQKKVLSQKKLSEELKAQSLLDKIKEVDGTGSGLDADLLRGLPAIFDSYGAPDGYQKLPSLKMWQWGSVIIPPETIVTVPFATAFPKQVFVVVGNPHSSSYSQSTATISQASYTKGSFSVRNNSTTTQISFHYMAIGE
ncbi:gp53-like domain-containing protein, partial [Morganella morganii]